MVTVTVTKFSIYHKWLNFQGDHLFGKPRNLREFDSCQWNVRDFTKSQRNAREKILS